jgi:hypothetical protein
MRSFSTWPEVDNVLINTWPEVNNMQGQHLAGRKKECYVSTWPEVNNALGLLLVES